MDIIDVLNSKSDLLCGKKAQEQDVCDAETELGLKFAGDYRAYLSTMSIAAYEGHELTGITKSKRTNVVEVTKEKRSECSEQVGNCYVIEDANFDQIVFWQQTDGKIFRTIGRSAPVQVAESLAEFVLEC